MYPSMHCTGGVYIPACTGQGVSGQGGVCLGGCLQGLCLPHIPVERMTDACENITFPQLRCGR